MARTALMLSAMLAGALISAQALAQDVATDASADRGRDLVLKHCNRCHSLAATGPSSEPTAPPFRDLYKRYPVENLGRPWPRESWWDTPDAGVQVRPRRRHRRDRLPDPDPVGDRQAHP
uniref:C-type cytochrome n=1 Tax=Phenylobacterium glaciei TaxID=2803784 RepID=A0A974S9J1_9CAUL|nr:c-type cytochrome [Phenylobacterium glaciei]